MPHAEQQLVELRRFALSRGGVVCAKDLRRYGVSTRAAGRRVEAGDWSRIGRAYVVAPQGTSLSDVAWCHILRITYGEGARISGHLAMRHGGWLLPGDVRIVVMARQPKSAIPGVVILRRPDGPAVHGPEGLRFTRRVEALLDALVVARPAAARDLLDAALQRRLITAAEFAATAMPRRGRGKRGADRLSGLVERALTGSRSEAEQRMRVLLKRSATGTWTSNHAIRDDSGRIVAEIDFAHEGLRIAIEVDGRAHHSDRLAFERDRERQNHLVLQGWLILRFTWEQITQRPQEVIAAVRVAVEQRAA